MKKILLPVLFSFIVVLSFGQDLKKAKSNLESKQLDKAKTEIDGYIAKKPDDPEGYYVKSKIYEKIASDSTNKFKSLVSGDARAEAFDAFKKATADSTDVKFNLLLMKDNYQPIF